MSKDLMQRTVSCVFPALDMYDLDEHTEHCIVIKTLICLIIFITLSPQATTHPVQDRKLVRDREILDQTSKFLILSILNNYINIL